MGETNRHHNPFYFDKEDYNTVSKYHWFFDSYGNICTKINGSKTTMKKLILGNNNCYGKYIHKNGKKNDVRKENLIPLRGYKNNGKTFLNGYIAIYVPEHKRAYENGCVYEHILVAEKMLGRELTDEECVHHVDLDRTNNKEDNLIVFATESDHISFHNGMECVQRDDGVYICRNKPVEFEYINRTKKQIDDNTKDIGSVLIKKNKIRYNLCPICKTNIKTIDAKTCSDCYNSSRSKNIPSKKILEEKIYKYSFTKIGKEYGVSSNAVRKWCKKYNLPYRKKDLIYTN